jgi:hypothetical protein
MAAVPPETHETLAGLSAGDVELVSAALTLREEAREAMGLDGRFALGLSLPDGTE